MTGFVYLINLYFLYNYSLRLEKGKTTVSVSPIPSLHLEGVRNEVTTHCLQNEYISSMYQCASRYVCVYGVCMHGTVCAHSKRVYCVLSIVYSMWFVLCIFAFRYIQWTTCRLLVHVDLLWSDHCSILDHEDKSNAALTIELVYST